MLNLDSSMLNTYNICNVGNLVSKMTFNYVYKPKSRIFNQEQLFTFIMHIMPLC
jgi:hypothetical protein